MSWHKDDTCRFEMRTNSLNTFINKSLCWETGNKNSETAVNGVCI